LGNSLPHPAAPALAPSTPGRLAPAAVSASDPPEHLPAADLLREIESMVAAESGRAVGNFGALRLETVFQPIVSLAHGRAVGYEALVRPFSASDGALLSPSDVFDAARARGESALLDGVCRTLHLVNFELQRVDDVWVFVNMTPSAILATGTPDPLFALLLDRRGVPPHQVVIEILESKVYDERRLAEVVRYFRDLGCVVALDDFGAGQSNFERIWRIAPNLVKLDRSMLEEATREPRVRRILPGLVGLLHEAGCLVVMEGIENEHQALIAMEMDVDFVQGFHFGHPTASIDPRCGKLAARMRELFRVFRNKTSRQTAIARDTLEQYTRAFDRVGVRVREGTDLETACRELLAIGGVDRCYLLDSDGVQIDRAVEATRRRAAADVRFRPFANSDGANWYRRPYFRRAVTRPGIVQVSQPYLSMSDGRSCMTLSVGVEVAGRLQVLCADLDWESWEPVSAPPSWRPAPNLRWNELEGDGE
jgi:EAL domain-containing protein (putative c-di-GMP-specific phosphodiesterase class I)